MNNITLITYSHTDYSDIWPIVCAYIEHIKDTSIRKIFACNKSTTDVTIKNYDAIVFYDDSKTYPQKLLEIMNYVTTKYVILIHDNDITINFNINKLLNLISLCNTHDIDRCMFGMVPRQDIIITDNDIYLTDARGTNIGPHFCTPYDVGPSIWKKECIVDVMTKFKNETYRTIETSEIQNYLKQYKIYALTTSPNYRPVYQIARPFPDCFQILHMIQCGKWFEPIYYMDLEEVFKKILLLFKIDMNIRGVGNGGHFMYVKRVL
jgi:hypothetical protein